MTVDLEERVRTGLRGMVAVMPESPFDARALVSLGRRRRRQRWLGTAMTAAVVAAVVAVGVVMWRPARPGGVVPVVQPSPVRITGADAAVRGALLLQGYEVVDVYRYGGPDVVSYLNYTLAKDGRNAWVFVGLYPGRGRPGTFVDRCDGSDGCRYPNISHGLDENGEWIQEVRILPDNGSDLAGAWVLDRMYADGLTVEIASTPPTPPRAGGGAELQDLHLTLIADAIGTRDAP